MSWGFIFQCMGMTIFLRQGYNPFADPMIFGFVPLVAIVVWIIKRSMDAVQQYFKIWQVEHNPIQRVDVSQINKLDNENNLRQQIKNLVTNPFRHKFMRVNREWIIHNIALILGGKNYMKNAGPELDFLQKIYQRAVNA